MTVETSPGFTAEDAVRTLDELKGYEETLAARTAGLTILVWAFVVAGIPLTYQGLAGWLSGQGVWGNTAMALLWLPWVAAAIVVMATLWKTHSIAFKKEQDGEPGRTWLWGLGFTALFFVFAALVHLVVGFEVDTFSVMGVTTGLLTLAIATANHYSHGYGRFWVPFYTAGVVILFTGLVLVATGTGGAVAAITTASVQGLAYFIAGSLMVARG